MADITKGKWKTYIDAMEAIDKKAAEEVIDYIHKKELKSITDEFLDFCFSVATKYGEASAAVACEMYDAVATLQGASVPSAVPAKTAKYGEVARAVKATFGSTDEAVGASVSRYVKRAGADTTLQNAKRDHAQFAWIPSGGATCAFCITLASRGWQYASKAALKGNHAEHIHAHCNCNYAIRFNKNTNVEGYDPDKYYQMYNDAAPGNSSAKVKALKRQVYAEQKDEINARRRELYAQRKDAQKKEGDA